MKLYMIRHGQSEDNLARRHSGWADCSLTPQGEEDARQAGERLRGIPFDKVFSSDTRRARQTCALALPEAEPEYTPLIRETNVGLLTGLAVADCIEKWGDDYNARRKARDFRAYGGEDLTAHTARIRKFLDLAAAGGWETVAAFSHGGSIHCALDIVLGEPADKALYPCRNGSAAVFAYESGVWSLEAWGI